LEGLSDSDAAELKSQIETQLRTAKQRPYDDAQVLAWLQQNAGVEAIAIERERQTSGLLHYDDLLRHAQRLLRVPEIARLYQAHFAAVLVDEFQDLSPQQLDLALRSSVQSRTFVGDPLQGIYSWAGARPARVEKQLRRICGQPSGLGVSYRSSPNVLAVLNTVAVDLGGHELTAYNDDAWFEGGISAGFVASTGEHEATSIVDMCRDIMERWPEATIGVISRMGWRRTRVDAAFAGADDVPHLRWDVATDDPEVVDLLRSAADRIGVGTADVDEALNLVGEWAARIGSFRAALELLAEPESDKPIAPGVHLLNAHVGKGLQFDWVFVPGFEQGHLPSFLAKRTAELLEEKRILVVILSRARHGIVFSRSKTLISKGGKEYRPDPSPWASLVKGTFSATPSELHDHIARLPPVGA
jgi:DNA helicase-2/ATP-dependent DNA helicase PcrA